MDHILKKNPDNFNEWFNEQFEKTRLKTEEEENGYGNWLISNEDCDNDQDAQVKNLSDMAKEIDKKVTYAFSHTPQGCGRSFSSWSKRKSNRR